MVDANSQAVDGSKSEGCVLNTPTEEVDKVKATLEPETGLTGGVKRKTLAGMLSEALCSRARRVSERRPASISTPIPILRRTREGSTPCNVHLSSTPPIMEHDDDETPFARRAREAGRRFMGGKKDG